MSLSFLSGRNGPRLRRSTVIRKSILSLTQPPPGHSDHSFISRRHLSPPSVEEWPKRGSWSGLRVYFLVTLRTVWLGGRHLDTVPLSSTIPSLVVGVDLGRGDTLFSELPPPPSVTWDGWNPATNFSYFSPLPLSFFVRLPNPPPRPRHPSGVRTLSPCAHRRTWLRICWYLRNDWGTREGLSAFPWLPGHCHLIPTFLTLSYFCLGEIPRFVFFLDLDFHLFCDS